MLYIIGGASRSGKSLIAHRFLLQAKVPYFSLDFLMMGFARGIPEFGLNPDSHPTEIAAKLWPTVRAMATTIVEDGIDYLLEGDSITPEQVASLIIEYPQIIRACFLGYDQADPNIKLQQIRAQTQLTDDWLRSYEDKWAHEFIISMIDYSRQLQVKCQELSIPYFDVSTDYEAKVDEILHYLSHG